MKTNVTWGSRAGSGSSRFLIAGVTLLLWFPTLPALADSDTILDTVASDPANASPEQGRLDSYGLPRSTPSTNAVSDNSSDSVNVTISPTDPASMAWTEVTNGSIVVSSNIATGFVTDYQQLTDGSGGGSEPARKVRGDGSVQIQEPKPAPALIPVLTFGTRPDQKKPGGVVVQFLVPATRPAAPNSFSPEGESELAWPEAATYASEGRNWNEPHLYEAQGFIAISR